MVQPRTTRAFVGGALMRVEQGIATMAKHNRQLDVVSFKPDELKQLFIPEWQRQSLTTAYELQEGGPTKVQSLIVRFDITPHDRAGTWATPRIMFRYEWPAVEDGFLVPAKWGATIGFPASVLESTPHDLMAKFNKVTADEVRHAYEWGLVQWVFQNLNDPKYCSTAAQLRYVWPAIVPIIRAGGAHDLAETLSQPSSRAGDSASVPAGMAPYLKTTYDIVAKAVLLREVEAPPVTKGIKYRLLNPNFEMSKNLSFAGYVLT